MLPTFENFDASKKYNSLNEENDYQRYFRKLMKKHKITTISGHDSIEELKAFFNDVSDGWNSKKEPGKDGKK